MRMYTKVAPFDNGLVCSVIIEEQDMEDIVVGNYILDPNTPVVSIFPGAEIWGLGYRNRTKSPLPAGSKVTNLRTGLDYGREFEVADFRYEEEIERSTGWLTLKKMAEVYEGEFDDGSTESLSEIVIEETTEGTKTYHYMLGDTQVLTYYRIGW